MWVEAGPAVTPGAGVGLGGGTEYTESSLKAAEEVGGKKEGGRTARE